MYCVVTSYPVVEGLNVPQAPAGAQLHVTPPFLLSFKAFATKPTGCPRIVGVGGGCTICTEIAVLEEFVPGSLSMPLQAERIGKLGVGIHQGNASFESVERRHDILLSASVRSHGRVGRG